MVVGSIKICFYVRYRIEKQTTSIDFNMYAIVNNGEIKPLTALHRKAICYELAEKSVSLITTRMSFAEVGE